MFGLCSSSVFFACCYNYICTSISLRVLGPMIDTDIILFVSNNLVGCSLPFFHKCMYINVCVCVFVSVRCWLLIRSSFFPNRMNGNFAKFVILYMINWYLPIGSTWSYYPTGNLLGLQPMPLDDRLSRFRNHILPVLGFRCAGSVFACAKKDI